MRSGRSADAVRQYRDLEQTLRSELNLSPSEETRALLNPVGPPPSVPSSPAAAPGELAAPVSRLELEPEGGAVPLGSPFYVERKTDSLFSAAIARQDSIVLVKGVRQVGKTSLLARGLQQARDLGVRVVLTDLQKITSSQMQSSDSLFITLLREIVDQLDLDTSVADLWQSDWGWNVNFSRILRREVLSQEAAPLVWGSTKWTGCSGIRSARMSSGCFAHGTMRAHSTLRPRGPALPWQWPMPRRPTCSSPTSINRRSTLVPRLSLDEFNSEEIAELNGRYGCPLRSEAEIARYRMLVGGHPYLVRSGLHTMADTGIDLVTLEQTADQEDGVFGDHLRRLRASLLQDPDMCAAMHPILRREPCPSNNAFYRLRSAGVVTGPSADKAGIRCRLYQDYLVRNLP